MIDARLQSSATCNYLTMSSVVLTQYASVTDKRTDRHRTTAYTTALCIRIAR